MKTKNPTLRLTEQASSFILLFFLLVPAARAANAYWGGVPGVSADTNWSDLANWPEPPGNWSYTNGADGPTYYNQVEFNGIGVNPNNKTAVNNVLDTTFPGAAIMPIWELDYIPTNGNYTTLINPGFTMQIAAGNGNLRVGADILHTGSPAPAGAAETITIEGPGAILDMSGSLYVGQGSPEDVDGHNVTLDLSGLDNFVMRPNDNYIYLAANAAPRANGVLYLAKTNFIDLGDDIQMSNQTGSSNSEPVALYLGINNSITLGSSGNFSMGLSGTTTNGAFVEFNPAFLGGATPPTAVFDSSANGGRINNFYVCATSQSFAGYALCNLSGGLINALINTLQVGLSRTSGAATGVLTFDMGTINVSSAIVSQQQSSGGGMAVGTVNINSNSTYHASAMLVVGGTLTMASVTGSQTPGTAGTININGGTLEAGTIANGGGTANINAAGGTLTLSGTGGTAAGPISSLSLSNSTLNLAILPAQTNIFADALATGGGTNVINITTAPEFSNYPATISLIKYQGSIGGSGYNFGLGTLPLLFEGYLANNTADGSVDLVLTSGPSLESWTDATGNNDWDITSTNWTGATDTYVDGDAVLFPDNAASGLVNLEAVFMPDSITVSNNALAYSWSGGGAVGGSARLTKQGPGTLVIDNSGTNNFTGGITLSGGILQVGTNDSGGNLPSGTLTDNGILVYDQTNNSINNNTISGAGAVVEAGPGGTLQLAGDNSFRGPVVITNNSTLQLGSSTAAGTGTNAIIVLSGSTLDFDGHAATKPVVVSGTGVNGNGALIDSGGGIYDNASGVATNITLAADTTFFNNSPSRWDLGSKNGIACVLGGAYNLTLDSYGYFEWANLLVTNVENIILDSGNLGIVGTTTFGNPAGTLTIAPGGTLQFYGPNNVVNKAVDFQNGGAIINSYGVNLMNGTMTIETGYCTFEPSAGTLTVSNVLSGPGFFYVQGGTGTIVIGGNSPGFSGGVLLYNGQVTLNGLIGGGVTTGQGTTLSGTGTADGLMDISGGFSPGNANSGGTFNAGGLTLESGASLTNGLAATLSGSSDLTAVTGNLTANGNTIYLNPFSNTLESGAVYPIITYTGSFIGAFAGAQTLLPTAYTFTVTNITSVTPKEIAVIVGGGGSVANLTWNNGAGNGQWDVLTSDNWTDTINRVEEQYQNGDNVTFNDSITNAATPATNVSVASGVTVLPSLVTVNSTVNYSLNGPGTIGGGASLLKMGAGALNITMTNNNFSSENTYSGNTIIGAGAVKITGQLSATSSPLGSSAGTLIISNGATLYVDLTGSYPSGDAGFGAKPIFVSGAGVNGKGAIQNIGNALYDDQYTLGLAYNVTMTGDTTVGGTARLDWGYPGYGTTLSTSGSNYNLTVIQNQYFQWDDLAVDTNLGNIDIYDSSNRPYTWGVYGMGNSLGNPTNVLTLHSNVTMDILYGGTGYPPSYDSGYAKIIHVMPTAVYENSIVGGSGDYRDSTSFILEGGSTFEYFNGTGGSRTGTVFSGPVTLNGLVNFQVGNSLITFSNIISGPGGFYMSQYGGNPPMCFAAVNTYTGITDLRAAMSLLLAGNGSISDSTPISLAAGASLITTNRVDGALTLAASQTLEGVGTVTGILNAGAGSTLLPGVTSTMTKVGTLSVSGNATLGGNIFMKFNNSSCDNLSAGGALTYGGTLTLTNISGAPLAAGATFKLFTAASYSGAFSSITPASPGPGLAWYTNNLTVNGTLSVLPPRISRVAVRGTNLTIMANGPAYSTYVLMESTNLLTPLPWTPLMTNTFNSNGGLSLNTNIISPNVPDEYYILQVQY